MAKVVRRQGKAGPHRMTKPIMMFQTTENGASGCSVQHGSRPRLPRREHLSRVTATPGTPQVSNSTLEGPRCCMNSR